MRTTTYLKFHQRRKFLTESFQKYRNSFEDNGKNLISIVSTQAPQRDRSQEVDKFFNVEK